MFAFWREPIASVSSIATVNRVALIDHFRSLGRIALEDEAWRMSRRPLARGTTAYVSDTLRGADNLGEAMRRIARGYNVIHGGNFNHVQQRQQSIVYRIDDGGFPFDSRLSSVDALAMMETVLIFVHAMLSLVAGLDLSLHLRRVRVRRRTYTGVTGPLCFWSAPLTFGSGTYQLEYSLAAAKLPIRADFSGYGTAEIWAQAISMLEGRDQSASDDMASRVKTAIVDGTKDQVHVARKFGCSVATLRRQLQGSGHGFRELRAEALNDQARALLDGRCALLDVAEALGFADGRSFARAFKSWNGITPSSYRRYAVVQR